MESYPIVLFPQTILEVLSSRPEIPPAPVSPVRPQRPSAPKLPDTLPVGAGPFLVITIIYFVLVTAFMDPDANSFIQLCSVVILLMLIFITINRKDKRKSCIEAYNLAVKEFPQLVLAHEYSLQKFQLIEQEYLHKLNKYNHDISDLLSVHNINQYRSNKLSSLFNDNNYSLLGSVNTPNTQGRAESFFRPFLLRNFKDAIHTDLGFRIYEFEKYYIPDFLYFKNGLAIDIEIDEPYEIENGLPTHFIGSDSQRNKFFLSKGFIVIRFAEEQIMKNPENCIAYINTVISNIQACNCSLPQFDSPVPTWSKDDSLRMAYHRYRDQYFSLTPINPPNASSWIFDFESFPLPPHDLFFDEDEVEPYPNFPF
jgi:very-short-patch-repair endonuclease